MLGNYSSPTKESGKIQMIFHGFKRKHKLCIEIYKSLNSLSSSFMKEILELILCSRLVREQNKLNSNTPRNKQVAFGTKNLESLGPKIGIICLTR